MRKFLDRRGQIGKLITIFPIMLLIFIIIGIFIFLSSTFSLSKQKDVFNTASISAAIPKVDLLQQEILVAGEKISVNKGLIDFGDKYELGDPLENLNKQRFDSLKDGLKRLLNNAEPDNCLIIFAQIGDNIQSKSNRLINSLLKTADDSAHGIFTIYFRKTSSIIVESDIQADYIEKLVPFNLLDELSRADYSYYEGFYYYGGCLGVSK